MSMIHDFINQHFCNIGKRPLPRNAFFLVGSNPLPIYATARALQPQKILLLGTKGVAKVMESLSDIFQSEGMEVVGEETCKMADTVDIMNKTGSLLEDAGDTWMFYTTGTKAMSVHSYGVWKEISAKENSHWAVYLAPSGPTLWFQGIAWPFSLAPGNKYEIGETCLKKIFKIHQIKNYYQSKPYGDYHLQQKYRELAKRIHQYVFKHGIKAYVGLLPPCHLEKEVVSLPNKYGDQTFFISDEISFFNEKNFKDNGFYHQFPFGNWFNALGLPQSHGSSLDEVFQYLKERPLDSKKKKNRIGILKWIATNWLECWVATALHKSSLFDEVHDDFTFKVKDWYDPKEKSQIDVCALRGYTPFVFSCTIAYKQRLGKSKLLEVRLRSNQLGGEHARAAVVCLSESPETIKKQLNEGWEGYGTIEIFGKDDIRNEEIFIEKVKSWIRKLETVS